MSLPIFATFFCPPFQQDTNHMAPSGLLNMTKLEHEIVLAFFQFGLYEAKKYCQKHFYFPYCLHYEQD